MTIVRSFLPWLQVFFLQMTEPSGRALVALVSGWLLLPGHSLADRIRAAAVGRHRASYYRVLAGARWSLDAVGWRLLVLFLRWHPQETLLLIGDDTFLPRKGSKVFAAGMHRDPCLSTRQRTIKRWGHCWVVLSVALRSRHDPDRWFCLPVMMRLHVNEATAKKLGRPYRAKTDEMVEMLLSVEQRLPQQKLHFIADYGYTAPNMLRRIPRRIDVTGRANRRAQLFAPAPPRGPGRGRPKVRGARLPSPAQLLKQRTKRKTFQISPTRSYDVRWSGIQGCFFQAPDRLVHVVALEHCSRRREDDFFFSTVPNASCEQILRWYCVRWNIETTFRDCKQHLAIGATRNRTPRAVERSAATGFLLYSLVVLWNEARKTDASRIRNYQGKAHASFADMLAALRHESLAEHRQANFKDSTIPPELEKIVKYLEKLLVLAA